MKIIFLAFALGSPLVATTYSLGTTPFTTNSRAEGALYTTQGVPNIVTWIGPDGTVRWTGNHATVDVTYYASANFAGRAGSGTVICLYSDGVVVGSCITGDGAGTFQTSSGQWAGLSGTHAYSLVNVGAAAAGSLATNGWLNMISELIVTGDTGAISQPSSRPLIINCGDSISGYLSSLINDSRQGDLWPSSLVLGYSTTHFSEYGALVSGTIKTDCPTAATNVFSGQAASAYGIVSQGGVNDANAGTAIGTAGVGCSAATFACSYYNMIAGFWAVSPAPNKVYVRGILPNSYNDGGSDLDPSVATYNTPIQSAVAQWNTDHPSTPACYFSTVGWFDAVTGTVSDHLHPTVASYATMANREIPVFSGLNGIASFSVSGPSSGTVGVASTNFTVSAISGATFSGETISLSDGASGSFSPSSTLTLTASASSVTFTYTPVSVGAKTIIYSGLPGCWTAPTGSSYTSTASPGTQTISGNAVVSGNARIN